MYGDKHEGFKFTRDVLLPIGLAVGTGVLCFVLGTVRAESAQQTQIEEMKQDIQKIRQMPDPSQVVTKDQLTEIVRRLDERTEKISQDVQYLREREEKRAK